MDSQIRMIGLDESVKTSLNQITKECIVNFIYEVAAELDVKSSYISFEPAVFNGKPLTNRHYLKINGNSAITVKNMKQGLCIEIKSKYELHMKGIFTYTLESSGNLIRIFLKYSHDLDLLKPVIQEMIFNAVKGFGFDCCSRYLECSEKGVCISTIDRFSVICAYADKLRNGINFYSHKDTLSGVVPDDM